MCFQWLSHQSHLYQELSKNYQPVQFSLLLSPSSMDTSTQALFGFSCVSFCFRHITKSDCVSNSQWEANLMVVNTCLSKAYWYAVCSYRPTWKQGHSMFKPRENYKWEVIIGHIENHHKSPFHTGWWVTNIPCVRLFLQTARASETNISQSVGRQGIEARGPIGLKDKPPVVPLDGTITGLELKAYLHLPDFCSLREGSTFLSQASWQLFGSVYI